MNTKRYKLWLRWNRGRYFKTLAEASKAAEAVYKATGIVLTITEEKGRALPRFTPTKSPSPFRKSAAAGKCER